jgi:hypothetical protein
MPHRVRDLYHLAKFFISLFNTYTMQTTAWSFLQPNALAYTFSPSSFDERTNFESALGDPCSTAELLVISNISASTTSFESGPIVTERNLSVSSRSCALSMVQGLSEEDASDCPEKMVSSREYLLFTRMKRTQGYIPYQ